VQTFPVPAEGRQAAAQRIAAFILSALPGKPLRVTVEKAKRQRSDPQNSYLFGVAYPLLAEAKGYEVNEIHEFMCGTHFGWVDKPCPKTPRNPEGLESKPFRTTTKDENGKRDVLGTVEFSDFVETVKRIAAHAGVYVPDPNE
jgi:hypothetical protein